MYRIVQYGILTLNKSLVNKIVMSLQSYVPQSRALVVSLRGITWHKCCWHRQGIMNENCFWSGSIQHTWEDPTATKASQWFWPYRNKLAVSTCCVVVCSWLKGKGGWNESVAFITKLCGAQSVGRSATVGERNGERRRRRAARHQHVAAKATTSL